MPRFKAVVFDLDGTLIDSAPDLRVALNKLLAEEGRRDVSLEEVKSWVGDGAWKLVERTFRATGDDVAAPRLDSLTRRFLAHYQGNATTHTVVFPGVVGALRRLCAYGIKLGICTNKPEQPTWEVLRGLDLDHYFDAVYGGDSIKGVRKPDPRPLQATLDRLGVAPRDAALVGDSANDVGAARALNMPVIVCELGYATYPADELGADAVVRHFAQVVPVLAHLP